MMSRLLFHVILFLKRHPKILWNIVLIFVFAILIALSISKAYQRWDDDPDRGAIAIADGAFGESYSTPVYLEQGWDEADSLWFYNTTQGSALLPYDFFLVLEQADSKELLRSNRNIDKFRYLPQKETFFNPDGLPVGFARDTYEGKDYMGFACAACHTGQINFEGTAIRIDGAPTMANMVGFLEALQESMEAAAQEDDKGRRFVDKVLALDNDYDSEAAVKEDLEKWTSRRVLYNIVNHSRIEYGYGRLDAFGRIYNRVLEHVLNKDQLATLLALTRSGIDRRLITDEQITKVLDGIGETILGDDEFAEIIDRLQRPTDQGYPGLSFKELLYVRNMIFNEPNAPVSYPFLWDIAQSDYVQWNGLASNAGVGPLGRNTGEVIGVFAILDWTAENPGFSLSGWISGQRIKGERIKFKSSINLVNLVRLEAHLRSLKSPQWPDDLGKIDREVKAANGRLIYAKYCQSCHELIVRDDWDRIIVGKMSNIDAIGTDPTMANNSVQYKGKSGNFKDTYQKVPVGSVIIEEDAPVVQILTSVTKGVIATPDADKPFFWRWADWVYTLAISFFHNEIKPSVKSGNYLPDTTANPYNSLLSYKARSLNGIWATAPYLHNGSVPTLYDLLLPKKRAKDPEGDEHEYRPDKFFVGSREFDPKKVGFRSQGYPGFEFRTDRLGNQNTGHEYAAGKTAQADGVTVLPPLTKKERWELIEYLKTL